jgi:hypothetical protein
MGIQIIGNGGTVQEVDGTTFRAARTTPRPIDHGAFGHYRVAQTVALVVSQAAAGTLFSIRWGDATRFMVIYKFAMSCKQTAAATATIWPRFQLLIARSFTASDSAGTGLTISGNNMKKRTNMGSSLITDIRFATVAAGLTVGTRTLDSQPIMELSTEQTITTPNQQLFSRQMDTDAGDGGHPIVLAQNEGIIVRGPTTVFGVAGTADLMIDLAWAEVAAY